MGARYVRVRYRRGFSLWACGCASVCVCPRLGCAKVQYVLVYHCSDSHIPTVSIQRTLPILSFIRPSSSRHHDQEPRRQYIHPRATSSVHVCACMHVCVCAYVRVCSWQLPHHVDSARSQLCDFRVCVCPETRGRAVGRGRTRACHCHCGYYVLVHMRSTAVDVVDSTRAGLGRRQLPGEGGAADG